MSFVKFNTFFMSANCSCPSFYSVVDGGYAEDVVTVQKFQLNVGVAILMTKNLFDVVVF